MGERNVLRYLDERPLLTVALCGAAGYLAASGVILFLRRETTPEQPAKREVYRELTWQPTDHNHERFDWAVLTSDRRSQQRSEVRPTQKISVLSAQRAVLDDYQSRWNGVQAVAYVNGSKQVYVGFDLDGEPLFVPDPADESRYAVGVSVGTTDLHAVIGIWCPEKGFMLDYETDVHEQATSPDRIVLDFPGVSFVSP